MRSYLIPVVVESDADAWRAYAPVLEARGVATWGKTKDEALQNIREVAQMVFEVMLEDGEALPPGVSGSDDLLVAVTVEDEP